MFGDKPTIADLQLGCELAQMKAIDLDFNDLGCPKLQQFVENIVRIPEVNQVTKEAIDSLIVFTDAANKKKRKAKL